jgi:tetrahydromethanopterin S-methyltransferase subunit G
MTSFYNIQDLNPKDYPKVFIEALDEPTELWQHAYRNHLSPAARSLLIVLLSFQFAADSRDLNEAFNNYRKHEALTNGISRLMDEFEYSLNELEGSFVRIEREKYNVTVGFQNASVSDFLVKLLKNNHELVLLLSKSLVFYDQFRGILSPHTIHYNNLRQYLGESKFCELVEQKVAQTLSRTAKRRMIFIRSDGTAGSYNLSETTIERNAIHALKMVSQLPILLGQAVSEVVYKLEEERIASGKCELKDLPEIIKSAISLNDKSTMKKQLFNSIQKKFEEIKAFVELDEILAVMELIEIDNELVSADLFQRAAKSLGRDSELLFDKTLTIANDEIELDEIEKMVMKLETTFDVALSDVSDSIEEKRRNIQMPLDKPPDDWDDNKEKEKEDATDNEIISMFASMSE